MKCSLGMSSFLEEISSPSHSIILLYFFALFVEKAFLISPYYSLKFCIKKLPTSAGSSKKQESYRKTAAFTLLITPKPLTMWITINWKILKEMGIPDHLTCLLRNLYAGQEATVRTGHGLDTRYWMLGASALG